MKRLHRREAFVWLLAAMLIAPPGSARAQAPRQAPLVFGSDLALVRISVVVRDAKGELVRGLKREDFVVTEDSKPQTIEAFEVEEVETRNAASDPLEPAVATGAILSQPPNAPTPAPVDFEGRRLVVLLFDSSGMEPDQLQRALDSAHDYLDERMTAADLVAVATIGSAGLEVGQDFTADKDAIRRALSKIAGVDDGTTADAPTSEAAAADDAVPADSFTPDTSELDLFNIDRRLRAIEDLSKALTPIIQKKSVLYFSNGLSGLGADNQVELRAAIDKAVKANLSIYPVDTRGLEAVVPGGDARQASRGGTDVFSGRGIARQFEQRATSQDALSSLASDTGGRAFFDANDFGDAFARVVSDTSAYYVIGYASTNPARDGKFRRVKVAVRQAGLRVEHRSGYYAERDFAHAGKDDRDRQLQDQLLTDLSATDFPVWLQASHFRTADNRFYIPLSVAIPGSALFANRRTDKADAPKGAATVDLIGVVQDEAKRAVARLRDTLKVQMTPDVQRKNLQYRTGFSLSPGRYRLKVVARENHGGAFGSFETTLVVPDLRSAAVKMSSVVFGTQLEENRSADRANPLVRDGSELLPSVTQVVSAKQPLYFYYEVYDASKNPDGGVRLLTSVAFISGGVRRYETPLVEATRSEAGDRGAAVFQLKVPAASLKPGLYACQVTVIDDVAGRFVFPRTAVLIRP